MVSSTSFSTSSVGLSAFGQWSSPFTTSAAIRAAAVDGGPPFARSSGYRGSPQPVEGDIKPELVKQYLSQDCMSKTELNKIALQAQRASFARFTGDTGSTEVQVAQLTHRIAYMTEHLKVHRKDNHSRKGLVGMLEQRKKLLKYIRRTDGDRYGELISRLGLKDRTFVESKY